MLDNVKNIYYNIDKEKEITKTLKKEAFNMKIRRPFAKQIRDYKRSFPPNV